MRRSWRATKTAQIKDNMLRNIISESEEENYYIKTEENAESKLMRPAVP